MKNHRHILPLVALLILVFPGPSFAERRLFSDFNTDECSAGSQSYLEECLKEKYDKSNDLISRHQDAALKRILNWKAPDKYINTAKKKLDISNKYFVKYRSAQCDLMSSFAATAVGNAMQSRKFRCYIELNVSRAEMLDNETSHFLTKQK